MNADIGDQTSRQRMKRRPKAECAPPGNALLLRVREAGWLLALSERQVWSLINTGELRAIRPAGMRVLRIAREDVEMLVAKWRAAGSDDGRSGAALNEDVGYER